ncbi:MAG: hypothetical protein ACTHKF_06835 [Candidatus Nitrosocosmicus sp.]
MRFKPPEFLPKLSVYFFNYDNTSYLDDGHNVFATSTILTTPLLMPIFVDLNLTSLIESNWNKNYAIQDV